jgi:hypothetical protein
MTFTKHVCWKPEMLHKVMNVEAIQSEEHIFLATHSPMKMYRQDSIDGGEKIEYTEESFFRDFIETPNFAFVPVLGTSGTGKSHLIRWLYTKIKKDSRFKPPHYKVIFVPRIGTNLKSIIELILVNFEGQPFDDYRKRLVQATVMLTEQEATERLLYNLVVGVGQNGKHPNQNLSEEEIFLIESLPALLKDPFFSENHWLQDNGIIHQLVQHVLGNRNSLEIIESKRQFTIEDLPLNIKSKKQASEKARDFYDYLIANSEIQKATVNWLNVHLDEAISQVLQLGQEDLQNLMKEVRLTLAEQGTELILLIEDFAKLQGIDREILEAILIPPQQVNGKNLCNIRTAIACTTGYFEASFDTVRTRTTFRVTLDVENVNQESLIKPKDVESLLVRYLNAVRLNEQEIHDWLDNIANTNHTSSISVPNACSNCQYQSECHKGFGDVEGIGLYPFNDAAIENMRSRINPGVFNPRTLIKNVLRYTLEYHQKDLEQGHFPSKLLLDHFGGSRLSPIDKQKIAQHDDPETAQRRETLLNLWSETKELCNFPDALHQAFDLPPLDSLTQVLKQQKETIVKSSAKVTENNFYSSSYNETVSSNKISHPVDIPISLAERLDALTQWSNGVELPQKIAQAIRTNLFRALESRIDWDSHLILKSSVINKLFMSGSIVFKNAATSQPRGIKFYLPLNEESLGDTVIALQGLLLYDHYQTWKFTYGGYRGITYYYSYARKLDEWSHYLLDKISRLSSKSHHLINPVPPVTEILALAGCIAGNSSNSLEDKINLLFVDLEKTDISNRSSSWKKLFEVLKDNQTSLREVIEARIACTKGGSSRLQIIDTAQLVEPLKQISSNWQPQTDISDISGDRPFISITNARKAIDELLDRAIIEEKERHLAIYKRTLNDLGGDFKPQSIIDTFQETYLKALNAGISTGISPGNLENSLEIFKSTPFNSYLKDMKKISEAEDRSELLPLLSNLKEKPLQALSEFLNLGDRVLSTIENNANQALEDLMTTGSRELDQTYKNIDQSFLKLKTLLEDIKRE